MTFKRKLFWVALVALVVSVGAMAAYMFYPAPKMGCDFDLRTNEACCVLEGVDPFDVWSEKVEHPPYRPDVKTGMESTSSVRRVNAYPPWAYTFAMPVALLPQWTAWYAYFALSILAFLGIGWYGYRYGKVMLGNRDDALLTAVVPILLVALAIGSCFQSGNYPIPVLCAMLAMVCCLDRGYDVLAGCCWAIAMLKPHMALLLAIPLLLRRKFLTCAVAAAICLAASVPPMLLCHKGLVELIRNGIGASTYFFSGCGTFPGFLIPLVGQTAAINLGLVIGVVVCAYLCWMTPRNSCWLVSVAPAAFVSTVWTYAQLYNSVVSWFVLVVMVIALLRDVRSKRMWAVLVLAALFIARPYTFAHGLLMLLPGGCPYSMHMHGVIDSVCSLAGLLAVIWFWNMKISNKTGETDVRK